MEKLSHAAFNFVGVQLIIRAIKENNLEVIKFILKQHFIDIRETDEYFIRLLKEEIEKLRGSDIHREILALLGGMYE